MSREDLIRLRNIIKSSQDLKKYTKNGIKLDMIPIDTSVFKTTSESLDKPKNKFIFF